MPYRKPLVLGYLVIITGSAILLLHSIGRDVLPKTNASQFQLRMRAPDGTRIEKTEEDVIAILNDLNNMVGKEHVAITSVYVGQHPSLFR